MNFFNKLAAILCTFACSSLCIGMEELSDQHRSNLISLAKQMRTSSTDRDGYLKDVLQFVDSALEQNGFLPSPVSLENLKSSSAPEQLIAFTKLCASLHAKTGNSRFYKVAFNMAEQLSNENVDFKNDGFMFLFQNSYEANDFERGDECLLFMVAGGLTSAEEARIEHVMAKIFSTDPEAIKQTQHLIHTTTKAENETVNVCFLNALCQLKSVPKLDHVTFDSIGGSYVKLSSQIADIQMRKKYMTQAMIYLVLGAKFGNRRSLRTIMNCLVDASYCARFYTCLIPLLRLNDPEAQDLFNKLCEVSEEALSWFKDYKKKQEKHKKYPAELEMVNRVMDSYYLYISEIEYQAALDQWESNPAEALQHLIEAQRFHSRKAVKKLAEIRESEQYKNPSSIEKDTYGTLLKKYDTKLAEETYQEYTEKKVQLHKNYQRSRYSFDHCSVLLHIATKFGDQQALKEAERIRKSLGYKFGLNGTKFDNPQSLSFDDYLGYSLGKYESAREEKEIDTIKRVDNGEHCSSEPVSQGADHKANITNTTHPVSTETISTTTASSTTTSIPIEKKDSVSSPLLKENETPLSTMSGEGRNIPPSDHQENRDPNTEAKVTKSKVQKTLERSNSAKILSRRNSLAHLPTEAGLNAEESFKAEPKRKELRRTVTLTSIPTSSSKDQGKKEVVDEKIKHHKNTLTTKLNWSLLNPWKDKNSKKGSIASEENGSEKPKSKRPSNAHSDQLTSKSESDSKKTPRKFSKKSSSSSLSSSRESSEKTNNSMNTLIDLGMLPGHAADYHHKDIERLHQILTHKYKLDNDDQNTLWVVLGKRESSFEVERADIKRLFSQFDETDGSHSHGSHEVITGMGITLNPNIDIDRKKKGSYHGQIEQVKDKIITRIAPKLTVADYEAAQNNRSSQSNQNNNNH